VKEQFKKIGGMEFYDVHFSYIDLEDLQERFINVPEQGGGGLIPEGRPSPGVLHTITMGDNGMPGVYRMEIQAMAGGGKLSVSGPVTASRCAWHSTTSRPTRPRERIHPPDRA
jgi:ATP-dependent Lon protease